VCVAALVLIVAVALLANGGDGGHAPGSPLAQAKQEAHRLAAGRQTSAARAERRRSRTALAGLSGDRAIAVDRNHFAQPLRAELPSGGLRLGKGEQVDRYLGRYAARISRPGGKPDAIVESTAPLRSKLGDGTSAPVDLSFKERGGAFVSKNPAVAVEYSRDPQQGVTLAGPDVSVSLAGVPAGAEGREEADRLVVPDAARDTDLWAAPLPNGFQTFAVLRSSASPEKLRFDLDLPAGAKLRGGQDGTAEVVHGGQGLVSISAPIAADADGVPVPVKMTTDGSDLVLSVPHRSKDLHYPLLVDPAYTEDEWAWVGDESPAAEGWSTYPSSSTTFDATPLYLPYSGRWYGGLYTFTHEGAFVNANEYREWRLDPPGTTTKVYRAEMMTSTNGLDGCFVVGLSEANTQTTGCGSFNYAEWVVCAVESCDQTKGTAGNYALWRISANKSETRNSSNKLIGSLGAAVVSYSDSDLPTFEAVNKGGTSGWVKSWSGEVSGPVRDNGVGMKENKVEVTGVVSTESEEVQCTGTSQDPCPRDLSTSFGISSEEPGLAPPAGDGKHKIILRGWDALKQEASLTWGNLWLDREGPNVEPLSGTLWDKSDKPNAEGKATATPSTLEPGSYKLKIPATDGALNSESGERSGVKSVEVKVDGETALAADSVSCPGGSCGDTREWTFATAEFPAGERAISVIAKDQIGNESVKTLHVIVPKAGELEQPLEGAKTSRWLQLKAHADASGYSTVRFQARQAGGAWANIPLEALSDKNGQALSSIEQPIEGSVSPLINWEVAKTFSPALSGATFQVQARAVFSGGPGGVSKAVHVSFDPRGIATDDARASVGPGEVNLATGNFKLAGADAELTSWGPSLSVSRALNSRDPGANPNGGFGKGWVMSIPVEGASDYASVQESTDAYGSTVVEVKTSEGDLIFFYLQEGKYVPEPGYETMSLTKPASDEFDLKDNEGNTVIFKKQSGTSGNLFVPAEVQQPGSEKGRGSVSYEVVGGVPRVATVLAPVPAGISCTSLNTAGCRSLHLVYSASTSATGTSEGSWGHYKETVEKIEFTAYDPATAAMKTDTVAEYLYDNTGRLRAEWDPRISPALKVRYGYDGGGRLSEITPPGESAWTLEYAELKGDGDGGRLKSVSRKTPQGTATTTVAYEAPLSGSGAPFKMGAADVAGWGQTDVPVGATAVFPPDSVPATPPSSYARAAIHYLDRSGREVNTAASGGGVSTSEYDIYGNAVRELSPANRQRALEAGVSSAEVAQSLDVDRTYQDSGREMIEELGPKHEIKLSNGESVQARHRTVIAYDEGAPGGADPNLPTLTTEEAAVVGGSSTADPRVTKTEYDWTLLKPLKTIEDYGGLNITRSQTYDSATGLEVSSYTPAHPATGSQPSRHVAYYIAGGTEGTPCAHRPEFANLPCEVKNWAMLSLPAHTYEYNRLDQTARAVDSTEDRSRETTSTYDAAGRPQTSKIATSTDPTNLVAAYGFDESSGTTTTDSSGNGNTGTLSNLTHVDTGRFGRALKFDSSSDKVTVADSSSLDFSGPLTLEAWVRPDEGTSSQIIYKNGGTPCASPLYALYSAPLKVTSCAGSFSASESWKLPEGIWSHIAVTVDAGLNAKVYLDGKEIAHGTVSKLPSASAGQMLIGSGYHGLIDEVRVYNRALTAQGVRSDMSIAVNPEAEQPTFGKKSGLVAAYGFEEEKSSSKPIDSSSKANNGSVAEGSSLRSGGHFGGGLKGSGVSSLEIKDPNSLDVSKGITVEGWIYPNELPSFTTSLLSVGSTYTLEVSEQFSLNALTFRAGSKYVSATFALMPGYPHYVAATYNLSTLNLYVDNELVAGTSASGAGVKDASYVKLGLINGRTDEIRVYNRALTAKELEEDSTTPVTNPTSALSNGTPLPEQAMTYDSATGRLKGVSTTEGGVTRTVSTTYDEAGRPTGYEDADKTASSTTYDIDGRPVSTFDGNGTQTYEYDSTSGLVTHLIDSQAGTFTPEYDATGQMIGVKYPNEMRSETKFDETGATASLTYRGPNCGSCVWYEEHVKASASGQWLEDNSSLSNRSYTYDGIGRLTLAKETPTGKGCTTRAYTYDADSNRLSKTSREPGEKGVCVTTGGGTVQSSTYDDGDAINNSGFAYDALGRIATVPASHSGGGELKIGYYANDMTRTESQDGVTTGWLLDPTLQRQRATIPAGSKQTIYHYADGSDSPSWTAETTSGTVTSWERPVGGPDGSLAAIVKYNGSTTTTELQMADLHGNVIGTASTSKEASGPTATFTSDEFGVPEQSGLHQYGWLGAKNRRTTLASGVVQMGVRAYVPAMGRFTSVDPVYGGSANVYDYANQDPIVGLDLTGKAAVCDLAHPAQPLRYNPHGRRPYLRGYGHFSCRPAPGLDPLVQATLKVCVVQRGIYSMTWGPGHCSAVSRFGYGTLSTKAYVTCPSGEHRFKVEVTGEFVTSKGRSFSRTKRSSYKTFSCP